MRFFRVTTILCGALIASGCAAWRPYEVPSSRIAATTPTRTTEESPQTGFADPAAPVPTTAAEPTTGPKLELIETRPIKPSLPEGLDLSSRFSATASLTVAVEGMPIRNFLNYVFGELLKVNYIVVDGAPGLDQAVTFNAQKTVSPRQLYKLVNELLQARSLGVTEKQGVFFIGPLDAKSGAGIPIGYGRDAADVPDIPEKILQIVPLKYGLRNSTLQRTIEQFVDAQVSVDIAQGALFVQGSRSAILKVLDLVRLFDQPSARGSQIGMITLTYLSPEEFIGNVTRLLANEGVTVDGSDLLSMVALDRQGAVVVFSSSADLLNRVEFWAKQIDRAGEGPSRRYFVFQPKFARAADLAESLIPLLGGPLGGAIGNQSRDTRSAIGGTSSGVVMPNATNVLRRDGGGAASAQGPAGISTEELTLTVDSRSNSMIFFTVGPKYESLLPMIRRLDVPPKQILIEATIAEVSLTGDFANGVEFAFTRGRYAGGTLGNLGLPGGGLAINFTRNITDQIRLRLRSSDSQVNVLSSPMIVVRDGAPATINVGNDIPTVGATASDPIQSDRTVTTVLYRNTGLTLNITPTINAQGSVLMQISQQISNTVPGSSGVVGAPIIFQRSVQTELVAGSGQSVLLAGLMSESSTSSNEGVPVLNRLPGVGALFKSSQKKREKTELVLLITPRIIESPDEWGGVMNKIRSSLEYLSVKPANVAP